MEFTDQILAVPLSIITTIVGIVVAQWLRPKSNIIWAETHGFTYLLPDPQREGGTVNVWVDSLYIQNAGKKPADDIEVIFNWPPQYFNIWPVTPHTPERLHDGRFVINVKSLAPNELFHIERLEVANAPPTVLRVRSREGGDAKRVSMRPIRVYPRSVEFCVGSLMLIGMFAIIYHAISFGLTLL